MEKRDRKEYKITTFWKEGADEDIIFWNYLPGLEMDVETAKQLVQYRLEYTQGKAVYTVIDGTNIKSTTKEARDYMNSAEGGLKGVLGGAFLSNSVVANLLINVYLKINHPAVPARFFTNKAEAVNWIKKVKAEKESLALTL